MEEIEQGFEKYTPYINDVLKRLGIVIICFAVSFGAGIAFSGPILKRALPLFSFESVDLNTTSPFQLFDLALNIGFIAALVVCIPIILYQIYSFIKNALHRNERRIFFLMIPLGLVLFAIGFVYGFMIMYSTIQLMANINTNLGIKNIWDISTFLSKIVSTSALLGLLFEFPIVLNLLIKTGLMELKYLKDKRRHAVLIMFVIASLLPPTDGISLLLMVLPLIVMYECTILYNKFT